MRLRLELNMIFMFIFLFSFFFLMVNETNPKSTPPGEDDYLIAVEKIATPIGGLESILKKISYPTHARSAGIQGKVYLLVYINEKGGVDDVKLVKGIGGGCDEEAISAVKKSKFEPGANNGVPVKTKVSLPITFKLS